MEYLENCITYEIYRDLRQSVGWRNFSEEQTRSALESSRYSLVAYAGGVPVGMARVVGDGLYDLIVDVVVRPSYQGQGIGTALIQALLRQIEAETPEGGRTSVQLLAEKGKEPFYERLGFKQIPHDHCGAGMRRIIYKG